METKDMRRTLRISKGLSSAQVRLLRQTKLEPDGLLYLHESQKNLTKSSKPEAHIAILEMPKKAIHNDLYVIHQLHPL